MKMSKTPLFDILTAKNKSRTRKRDNLTQGNTEEMKKKSKIKKHMPSKACAPIF